MKMAIIKVLIIFALSLKQEACHTESQKVA